MTPAEGFMLQSTLITGWSARVSHSRWEDPNYTLSAGGPPGTLISAQTLAFMNVTTFNQATRCIHVDVPAGTGIAGNPIAANVIGNDTDCDPIPGRGLPASPDFPAKLQQERAGDGEPLAYRAIKSRRRSARVGIGESLAIAISCLAVLAAIACRPALSMKPGDEIRGEATTRELCDQPTREALRTRLAALPFQRERMASYDDPALRALLHAPCLETIGARILAEASAGAFQKWWFWNFRWLLHEVLRKTDEPLRQFTIPSSVRLDAVALAARDPVIAALVREPDSECLPTEHWVSEAERLFELEAYDRGHWHHRPPVPRLTRHGYPESSLGKDCLAEIEDRAEAPTLTGWRECLLQARDRRMLTPGGSFCQPTRGTIELSFVSMSCVQRLEVELAEGEPRWSGDCDKPVARLRIPLEAVRRAAFFAALRPHLVMGSEFPDTVDIPVRFNGGEIKFVPIGASSPRPAERRRPSHQERIRYHVTLPGGEVSGVCFQRAYSEYGEGAVCSALDDLWMLAHTP